MLRSIYFLLLGVLLWSFWRAARRVGRGDTALTPILGWIVGLTFFFLAPLTLMVLNGGYEDPGFYATSSSHNKVDFSNLEFFVPFLVIWTSLILSAGALLLFVPTTETAGALIRRPPEIAIERVALKKVIFITIILSLLDYGATIRMAGGIDAFLYSNWYERGVNLLAEMGDRYVLYLWLSQANQTIFTAAAVLYTGSMVREGRIHWRFSLLLVFVFLLHIAFKGERIYLALYLLSLITLCWLHGRKKMVVGLVLAAPVLAAVFSAWAYFRNDLTKIGDNVSVYADADIENRTTTWLMDACDGDDMMFLFHIIKDFGNKYEYLYGTSYVRVAYFFLPRSIFPEKPHGFNLQLAELYEPGEATSFCATQLGELYANFGPFGILLLPALTLTLLLLSNQLRARAAHRPLLVTAMFLLLIWCARSTLEDQFITFLLVFMLIGALRLERGLTRVNHPIEAYSQGRLEPSAG